MKDKSSKKIGTKQIISENSLFDIPDSIIPIDKRIFYPDWTNQPPAQKAIITLQGNRILTIGNLLSIVSQPGVGKTSSFASLIASHLNPDCDSLGFKVELPVNRNKILYIDTEQTRTDTWEMWEQTYTRAGIKKPTIDKKLIFVNFKAISVGERKKAVEEILNKNSDIGLVMFDGAGDFVRDINSIIEATDFIDWINTFNPNISLATSLHTNPKTDKPRGHIGSELYRRSGAQLLIKKLDDNATREITTNFEHGKVRKDNDSVSAYFKWSEEEKMFVSASFEKPPDAKKQNMKHIELVKKIYAFNKKEIMSHTELKTAIMNMRKNDENTAKGFIRQSLMPLLEKVGASGYKMKKYENINENDDDIF